MDCYYDSIAPSYDELYSEEQQRKVQLIQSLVHHVFKLHPFQIIFSPDTKLLDIGTGSGVSSDFPCKVTGIDPSSALLFLARKKYPTHMYLQASAEQLPFKDAAFDIIISLTAIHNFSDKERAIKEMKRAGKRLFIISLLRKSHAYTEIMQLIKKHFIVVYSQEEEKDTLLFLTTF